MKFIFLGDVHNNIRHCINVANQNPDATIIQVGDLGIGSPQSNQTFWSTAAELNKILPANFRFFVGNHDCRTEAKKTPHCLSDYGEAYNRFFFVSGADSIDRASRIEGLSWWADEELSIVQANDCLDKWKESKLNILVSHDCPQSFAEGFMLIYDKTLTRSLLQEMIDVRKPKMVIFGHHHNTRRLKFNDIDVVGLGVNETFEIDI